MKKLIPFKFLKKLTIEINGINNNELSNSDFNFTQVEKLNIIWKSYRRNYCQINKLQKIFPNLTDIDIKGRFKDESFLRELTKKGMKIRIIEKKDSKINKISISGENEFFNLYCQSLEHLVDVNININFLNLEEYFPIFSQNCNVIFKSLTNLTLKINNNFQKFNNFCNNFEKMPNLKKLDLYFDLKDSVADKDIYELFVKKVLFKLEQAKIKMGSKNFKRYYSSEELLKINPDLDAIKLIIFKISKYNELKVFGKKK